MRNTKVTKALAGCVLLALASVGAQAATFCPNQNFDSVTPPALPSGWTSSVATGAATTNGWVTRAVGYADTGANSAWVDDIDDYADVTLTSPAQTVTTGTTATITYRQSYVLWAPDARPLVNRAFNGAVLEVSIDSAAFADIVTAGGSVASAYTASLDPNEANPIAATAPFNRPVWSGDSGGFTTVTATLPASASGKNVAFRWRLGTEGGARSHTTHSGWWIDSISFAGISDDIFSDGFDGTCGN
ncbi:MAG TPA: hypothetical protein VH082_09040 [Rudaea sp.]|nr:hypothetical protein [Rudaea sp.]